MSDISTPCVQITLSREATVGDLHVRRALPTQRRRTVGAWCFADHMGPEDLASSRDVEIAPHPHIGLQTVTWLFDGEFLHRDSLGSEQLIRPGQLNLMRAGHGVAHSEQTPTPHGSPLHGVQLWLAQSEVTRNGPSSFEHHATLPECELRHGLARVLVGEFASTVSPAHCDGEYVGVELDLSRGLSELSLRRDFEYALIVASGALDVETVTVAPGRLAYLGTGRDELALTVREATRIMLLGGVALSEPILMWWNFVARTRQEISEAHGSWVAGDERFGPVASSLKRTMVPAPPWTRQR